MTPSLLEKGNYVMKHEYPDAQKAGKTVLPAEMVKTDPNKLSRYYKGLPERVNAEN